MTITRAAGVALLILAAGCAVQDAEPEADPARGTNTPTATNPLAECEAAMREQQAASSLVNTEYPPECDTDAITQEEREALLAEIAPEASVAAPSQDVLALGATATYGDGLEITVSAPKAWEPSEYAAGHEAFDHHLVFPVRVVNGTEAPYDVPLDFYLTVQSSNAEGSEIYDEHMPSTPQTAILPGREAEWQQAFAVADPADLVVEVTAGWERDPVFFTTSP
jgi:hypothetical protein